MFCIFSELLLAYDWIVRESEGLYFIKSVYT
jgi:hypothetical protein